MKQRKTAQRKTSSSRKRSRTGRQMYRLTLTTSVSAQPRRAARPLPPCDRGRREMHRKASGRSKFRDEPGCETRPEQSAPVGGSSSSMPGAQRDTAAEADQRCTKMYIAPAPHIHGPRTRRFMQRGPPCTTPRSTVQGDARRRFFRVGPAPVSVPRCVLCTLVYGMRIENARLHATPRFNSAEIILEHSSFAQFQNAYRKHAQPRFRRAFYK